MVASDGLGLPAHGVHMGHSAARLVVDVKRASILAQRRTEGAGAQRQSRHALQRLRVVIRVELTGSIAKRSGPGALRQGAGQVAPRRLLRDRGHWHA